MISISKNDDEDDDMVKINSLKILRLSKFTNGRTVKNNKSIKIKSLDPLTVLILFSKSSND